MFFAQGKGLEESMKNVAGYTKLADVNVKNLVTTLADSITNVRGNLDTAFAIQQQTAKQVRETLGQTRVVSNQVKNVIAQASKATGLIGIHADKNIELFGALNASMQRNTFFTDEQITKFQALGFTANLTAQELAQMATSFDTLGFTTDETLSTMEMMTKEARSYGLNVSQFMAQVNKNLGLMVGYNFKNGVDGLAKMVAQAQALRIDMAQTKTFADGLLDPSKAIETAAGFQMLGGEIGALGDPFKLLNMAQTDMAGLQDELVKMASASVSFNKQTGKFDIPVTQMYRLREAADLANMSYEDFTEMAMNAAQRTEKLKLLDQFNTVPEEQKELIASLGKIGANGNLEITMPDGTVKKIGEGFNELVGSDYGELQKMLDVNNMSELDVARASLGYLEEIKYAQNTLIKLMALNVVQSEGFENLGENLSKSQRLLTNELMKKDPEMELPDTIIEGFGTVATALNVNQKNAEDFADFVAKVVNTISNTIDTGVRMALDKLDFDDVISSFKDKLEEFDLNELFSGITDVIFPNKVNAYFQRDNFPNSNNNDTFQRNSNNDTFQRNSNNSNSNEQPVQSNNVNTQILPTNLSPTPQPIDTNSINNNAVNNISTASNNNNQTTPSPQNNQTPQFQINGEVKLTIADLPTNSNISKETLAELLVRNPQAMSIIESQLNNINTWA